MVIDDTQGLTFSVHQRLGSNTQGIAKLRLFWGGGGGGDLKLPPFAFDKATPPFPSSEL